MKKETYKEFKARIKKEGYDVIWVYSNHYRIFTPGRRSMVGTLDEIKDFIGE